MYQAIGVPKLFRYVLLVNALVVLALVTVVAKQFPGASPWSMATPAVLVVTSLLFLVGQTPVFPWLCAKVPFLSGLFPDLDGIYDVEIASNWSLISAREKGDWSQARATVDDLLFTKTGTLTIKARLFTVDVRLEMADDYMVSDTVVVGLRRESGLAALTMSYVYRATVQIPQTTDSSQHFGAARIHIPDPRDVGRLSGTYWTDRNWHQARNTAGKIVLKKRAVRRRRKGRT